MSLWKTVWVVLMMFWLFFGGYIISETPRTALWPAMGSSLIPFLCVLILGLCFFKQNPNV